ncbi:MAG: TIGR01459 family HAD-type hydrolase [Hyphomicrobiaceae bacterium]
MTSATPRAGIPILASISALASAADVWLSDVWGVIHNGRAAFPAAVDACATFRAQGGTVILITNAPRPDTAVAEALARLGVPRAAWDAIVTSGDVTRDLIRPWGRRPLFHLGPARDAGVFAGLDVSLADAEAADAVVCTGLFDDETETPETYRPMLERFVARGTPMICANPDVFVERGDRLIPCAGGIAQLYRALGGDVVYAGKPYAPIYERAFAIASSLRGKPVPKGRMLAIGDGLKTDLLGAGEAGLRSIFIASALHVDPGRAFDAALLAELFATYPYPPIAAQPVLRW